MKNRLCIFLKNPYKEQIVDSKAYQVFQMDLWRLEILWSLHETFLLKRLINEGLTKIKNKVCNLIQATRGHGWPKKSNS